MTSSDIRSVRNARGETAYTDGSDWWLGSADGAPGEGRFWLAQMPVLLCYDAAADGLTDEVIAKARRVFIAGLRNEMPTVKADAEEERLLFRDAWNDARDFAERFAVGRTGAVIFSARLRGVGVADAMVSGEGGGAAWPYCYTPRAARRRLGRPMNALAQMLALDGCPVTDAHGIYTTADAAHMATTVAAYLKDWKRETVKGGGTWR